MSAAPRAMSYEKRAPPADDTSSLAIVRCLAPDTARRDTPKGELCRALRLAVHAPEVPAAALRAVGQLGREPVVRGLRAHPPEPGDLGLHGPARLLVAGAAARKTLEGHRLAEDDGARAAVGRGPAPGVEGARDHRHLLRQGDHQPAVVDRARVAERLPMPLEVH